MFNNKVSVPAVFVLAFSLTACGVHVNEKSNGSGDKDVTIHSPVGNLHVGEDVKGGDTGIAVYPGAKLVEKSGDHDSDRANINISTPIFGLRLVVVKYTSDDSPQMLVDFYANELKRYGKVLQCKNSEKGGDWHVGIDSDSDDKPKHGSEITCTGNDKGTTVELKVGTNNNAHIVAVTPKGKGAEFALVYVRAHSDNDSTI
jgi:hypothetical protein